MFICVFNCNSQRMRRFTSGAIYANSYGKTIFKFNFNTPDWNLATTKVAVFSCRGENYTVSLDEDNMCKVPAEVLISGAFQVSIQSDFLITNMVRIPVSESDKQSEDLPDVNNSVVFIPQVSKDKILSWTNNGGLNNPDPIDLNVQWIDSEEEQEEE